MVLACSEGLGGRCATEIAAILRLTIGTMIVFGTRSDLVPLSETIHRVLVEEDAQLVALLEAKGLPVATGGGERGCPLPGS